MNDWNPDDLVEQLWSEFQGEVPWSRIHEVVSELVAKFEQAKVKAYVPIFIRRQAMDRLCAEGKIDVGGALTGQQDPFPVTRRTFDLPVAKGLELGEDGTPAGEE